MGFEMPFKIVRNDITKMNTEAIVNTANEYPVVGPGCDSAVYKAAGYEELLAYRTEKIGIIPEGEVFITPGFALSAKYIIHAVSPL
ncbi:MAG: macro domain-containing protein, partial [Lachnospiraceae bacterium]|nr:macro domain-containing protein [Lachnospiraceae bacterium]